MLCCKRKKVNVRDLQPYEFRLHLLEMFQKSIEEHRLSEAKGKLNEVSYV